MNGFRQSPYPWFYGRCVNCGKPESEKIPVSRRIVKEHVTAFDDDSFPQARRLKFYAIQFLRPPNPHADSSWWSRHVPGEVLFKCFDKQAPFPLELRAPPRNCSMVLPRVNQHRHGALRMPGDMADAVSPLASQLSNDPGVTNYVPHAKPWSEKLGEGSQINDVRRIR